MKGAYVVFLCGLAVALWSPGEVKAAPTFSTPAIAPHETALAVDTAGTVYLLYSDLLSTSSTYSQFKNLYLLRSTDGGTTFSAPKLVVSDAMAGFSMAVGEPGRVHIAYVRGNPTDYCLVPGLCSTNVTPPYLASVQFIRSIDGGQNFSLPIEVSTPGATNVDFHVDVAVDSDGFVYVAWAESGIDPRSVAAKNPYLVRFRISDDGGLTFNPPLTVQADSQPGGAWLPRDAQVVLDRDAHTYVAWTDCIALSTTCSNFALRYRPDLQSSPVTVAQNEYLPGVYDMAADSDGNLSFVYLGTTTPGSYTTRHVRVENGAITNRTDVSRTPSPLATREPSAVVDATGTVWVAWSEDPPGSVDQGAPNDLFASRSSDWYHFAPRLNVSESSPARSSSFFEKPGMAATAMGALVSWIERVPGSSPGSPGSVLVGRVECPKRISGRVLDGHDHGLEGALVELVRDGAVMEQTATDTQGKYTFSCIADGQYAVRAWLWDFKGDYVFDVRYKDDATAPAAMEVTGLSVGPGQEAVTRDVIFSEPIPADVNVFNVPSSVFGLLDDMASIFYRTRQFVDWAQQNVGIASFSTSTRPTPVEIYTFATDQGQLDPSFYNPDGTFIKLGQIASFYFNRDADDDLAPEGAEWHEFVHHVFETSISDVGYSYQGHDGYLNPDTMGSFNEGLAEFLPTLAWQTIGGGTDSSYSQGYYDLESNNINSWTATESGGVRHESEEFAIAALLWDLMDNSDPGLDRIPAKVVSRDGSRHVNLVHVNGVLLPLFYADNVRIPIRDLWTILDSINPDDATVAGLWDVLNASPLVPAEAKSVTIDLDDDGGADVSPLGVVFLMHGFFEVNPNRVAGDVTTSEFEPHHGHYWVGTVIGRTDHVDLDGPGPGTASAVRRSPPSVPNANLLLNVRDSSGAPLQGATALLTVVYPESTTTLTRTLAAGTGNLEHLEMPPHYRGPLPVGAPLPSCNPGTDYVVTVTVSVTHNGIASPDQFTFNNCQYTQALAAATGGHVLEFTFTVPAGDSDGDGIGDSVDNCSSVANANQADADHDGYGNLCDADLNNSGGTVNFTDLAIFRTAFGTINANADLNSSGGTVNFADLATFRALFGKPAGPSGLHP